MLHLTTTSLIVLLVAGTGTGCSCNDESSDGSSRTESTSSVQGQRSDLEPTTLVPRFEIEPAAGQESASVVVALSSKPELCEATRNATEGRVHLICGQGLGAPLATGLRHTLTRLKQNEKESVQKGAITLLATDEHASAVRMLTSQEPTFFARLGVWTGPRSQAQLGNVFVANVGPRGCNALVFVGRTKEQLHGLARMGKRKDLRIVGLPNSALRPTTEQVRAALEALGTPGFTMTSDTDHADSSPERAASGLVPNAVAKPSAGVEKR